MTASLPQSSSPLFGESFSPDQILVSSAQMQAIEQQIFTAGMPVEALMEAVGQRIYHALRDRFPADRYRRVGLLIGAGHNGGDGAVVGRELRLQGREISIWVGHTDPKPLTATHLKYLSHLGAQSVDQVEDLAHCDLLIDAMFGIGLTRPLEDPWVPAITWANQVGLPMVSIDLPSGLNSETGAVEGSCIRAQITYCLGLWKQGLWQDQALKWIGDLERIDVGIPDFALQAVLAETLPPRLLTESAIRSILPPQPALATHKYRQGHLLIIAGSLAYPGAAILTGLGARPSGSGMVTVAVLEELKGMILHWMPEALVHSCPDTGTGVIASLRDIDLKRYTAFAIGPGLTKLNQRPIEYLLSQAADIPWVLDADALNILAELGVDRLQERQAATILTPHSGEFSRLFPEISLNDRIKATQQAARQVQATILLKGARTLIADPSGQVWVNPVSTPALARGGSGDVLTGLIGGLLAQGIDPTQAACLGAWWHSQTALDLEQQRGVTGVDPVHLADQLAGTWARVYQGTQKNIPSFSAGSPRFVAISE